MSQTRIKQFEPFNVTGDANAVYWMGPLTRREAQSVFDEFKQAVVGIATRMQQLDASLAYMADKFGIKPEDVNEWVKAKVTPSPNA